MSEEAPAGARHAVRPMRIADVAAVVDIEREAFTSPWRATTFHALLERPTADLWVLEEASEEIVGYAVVWCILDQGEIANLAVAEDHRGRGLGALLLREMLGVATRRGVKSLYLEVRISNDPARALYERFGFRQVGRRADYYDAPREDALVMMKRL